MAVPRGQQSRTGTPISLIAIHTNEGNNPPDVFPDRTAENLAAYLDRPEVQASYHVIVDDDSTVRYLPDTVASWSLLSGNARSLNVCFTGWARWTREEWLIHPAMLVRGAAVVAHWCRLYGIPVRRLSLAQVAGNERGLIGHVDWTHGKRQGNHTDPGAGFPWVEFLALINGGDDMLLKDERDALYDIREQLTGARSSAPALYPGWPARADMTDKPKTLLDYVRALHAELGSLRRALPGMVAEEVRTALSEGVLDVEVTVRDKTGEPS